MKSLLVIDDHAFDVSGLVQTVEAHDEKGLKYRGNGIVIYRANHVDGPAPIFLKFVAEKHIFGQRVNVYGISDKWRYWDYSNYTLKADKSKLLIDCADHLLRKKGVLL